MRKQSNWFKNVYNSAKQGVKGTYNRVKRDVKGAYNRVNQDVKDTYNGFKPRHLVPDWLASRVFDDYTPGNIESSTELAARNVSNQVQSEMRNIRKLLQSEARIVSNQLPSEARNVSNRVQATAGNSVNITYNPQDGVATFNPRSDNAAVQHFRYLFKHNPTAKNIAKVFPAIRERIESARRARIRYGVPEDRAPYYMNYDAALVGSYSDPITGLMWPMPKLPEELREQTYYNGPARYKIDPKNSRANAHDGDPDWEGRLGLNNLLDTYTHEGFLKYLGHFGTRSAVPLATQYPIVTDEKSKLAGMPYYSMSTASVGGDPGFAANADNYAETVKDYNLRVPTIIGEVYNNIAVKHGGKVNSYFTSPVEFSANASIFKTIAAGQGRTDLNTFDVDNPDQFLKNFDEVRNSALFGSRGVMSEISPEAGRKMRALVDGNSTRMWGIRRHFQRYADLHGKYTSGEPLTKAEMNEYKHYRKALPAIWDQASNRRTGVHTNPYRYTTKGIPS